MATTVLDAPALALDTVPTFTVSAGSNRRAYVLAIYSHGSNAAPVTSMTLGGQTMSVVSTVDDDANSFDVCLTLFELLETGIAAMSGSTITPTGGTYNNRAFLYWSVQGATQGTVTPVTAATSGTSGSVSLARVADSWTLGVTVQDFTGTAFTGLADPAEAAENSVTNADIAYGYGTDTSRTASFTWTHSTSRNNVTLALNIAPAASGPTISSVDSTPEHLAAEAFTGTGFPTSQTGSAAVKFVGVIETVTLTPTYDTATALSAAFDVGNNKFGVAGTVTVTDSSGNVSSGYAVTPQPRSGGAYVNLSTLAVAAFRLEAIPDLQSGYQVEYYGGVGCTCGTDLILFDDATVQYPTGAVGFYARAHNGTSWGAPAFISISDLIAERRGHIRSAVKAVVRPVTWDTTN